MCGSEERLFKTLIEGTELNLCKKCTAYGKVVSEVRIEVRDNKKVAIKRAAKKAAGPEKEILQVIVPDYGQRIRKAREALGLNQKDFAKRIHEKISVIHHMEINKFEPSISLARKLESFLKIELVEQHEEDHKKIAKIKSDTFTIGDFIKVKR